MNYKRYKLHLGKLSGSEVFREASAEELRVLLALYDCEGLVKDDEELASKASVSLSRVRSALTLWTSEEIVALSDGNITEEFSLDEGMDITSVEAASTVRDQMLEQTLRECASLLEKPALSTEEIKSVTYLYDELSLSAEYILTLLSYLKSKGKRITPREIRRRGDDLTARGYTTTEGLEVYIKSTTKEENDLWEIRKVIGIFNRNLSAAEIKYFKKWINDLEYGTEIISQAYDIATVATGTASLQYMDKILSNWHSAGFKTVAECLSSDRKSANGENAAPKRRKKSEEPKLRYGNFDIDEAIEAALERSFSNDDD